MATVLFVCLHNAGRSQMSQALFEQAAAGRHTALSAGTTPGRNTVKVCSLSPRRRTLNTTFSPGFSLPTAFL